MIFFFFFSFFQPPRAKLQSTIYIGFANQNLCTKTKVAEESFPMHISFLYLFHCCSISCNLFIALLSIQNSLAQERNPKEIPFKKNEKEQILPEDKCYLQSIKHVQLRQQSLLLTRQCHSCLFGKYALSPRVDQTFPISRSHADGTILTKVRENF